MIIERIVEGRTIFMKEVINKLADTKISTSYLFILLGVCINDDWVFFVCLVYRSGSSTI